MVEIGHCLIACCYSCFCSLKIKMSVVETMAELFPQVLPYLGWQWNAKRYVDITGMFKLWHRFEPIFVILEDKLVVFIENFSFTIYFLNGWLSVSLSRFLLSPSLPLFQAPCSLFFSSPPQPTLWFRLSE